MKYSQISFVVHSVYWSRGVYQNVGRNVLQNEILGSFWVYATKDVEQLTTFFPNFQNLCIYELSVRSG
jgi:hypothetical protein